jgi:FkbM family methyltransferase
MSSVKFNIDQVNSSNVKSINFNGHRFLFAATNTLPALINEIFSDNYHIIQSGLQFSSIDTIVDLGANEGIFSILMAKLFPSCRIIAVEPIYSTYKTLITNIGLNKADNVYPVNVGIAAVEDKYDFTVSKDFSGGSSAVISTFDPAGHVKVTAPVIPLDKLFSDFEVTRCKLLKIDVEGMEHEILLNTNALPLIDNLVGEFHINKLLSSRGYSLAKLITHVKEKTNLLHYETCFMAE